MPGISKERKPLFLIFKKWIWPSSVCKYIKPINMVMNNAAENIKIIIAAWARCRQWTDKLLAERRSLKFQMEASQGNVTAMLRADIKLCPRITSTTPEQLNKMFAEVA